MYCASAGLSFLCIIYTFLMLVSLCAKGPRADTSTLNIGGGGTGIAIALPVLLVAATMHYNVPKYFQELRQRSLRRLGAVVALAFTFVLVRDACVAVRLIAPSRKLARRPPTPGHLQHAPHQHCPCAFAAARPRPPYADHLPGLGHRRLPAEGPRDHGGHPAGLPRCVVA